MVFDFNRDSLLVNVAIVLDNSEKLCEARHRSLPKEKMIKITLKCILIRLEIVHLNDLIKKFDRYQIISPKNKRICIVYYWLSHYRQLRISELKQDYMSNRYFEDDLGLI